MFIVLTGATVKPYKIQYSETWSSLWQCSYKHNLNEEIFLLPVYFNILRIKIIKNEIMKLGKEIEENVT